MSCWGFLRPQSQGGFSKARKENKISVSAFDCSQKRESNLQRNNFVRLLISGLVDHTVGSLTQRITLLDFLVSVHGQEYGCKDGQIVLCGTCEDQQNSKIES